MKRVPASHPLERTVRGQRERPRIFCPAVRAKALRAAALHPAFPVAQIGGRAPCAARYAHRIENLVERKQMLQSQSVQRASPRVTVSPNPSFQRTRNSALRALPLTAELSR
jgi:hypothetical protein